MIGALFISWVGDTVTAISRYWTNSPHIASIPKISRTFTVTSALVRPSQDCILDARVSGLLILP